MYFVCMLLTFDSHYDSSVLFRSVMDFPQKNWAGVGGWDDVQAFCLTGNV